MTESFTKTSSRIDEWNISKLHKWENSFNSKTIFVNKGKKNRHSLQILASLALLGPSTTREIAKFVIMQGRNYPYQKPRNRDSRILEQMFLRLIDGRQPKKTGKRKSSEKYPGLESNHYVRKVGKKEKRDSDLYTLTLNGFLFALGFDFGKDEFEKFLDNAGKHHIFFAYVKKISETTSIPFIKKIFLDPIREIIVKNRISLDEDISFYFSNIIESIGRVFGVVTESVHEFIDDEEDVERRQRVREILKWTFYDDRATSDWYNAMIDVFYPNQNDNDFFRVYSHTGSEQNLLYKIMQKIHFTYFGYWGSIIPIKAQKIPYSKRWLEFKKYYPQFKSPSDYDKKRKVMIKYDANHVPDRSP